MDMNTSTKIKVVREALEIYRDTVTVRTCADLTAIDVARSAFEELAKAFYTVSKKAADAEVRDEKREETEMDLRCTLAEVLRENGQLMDRNNDLRKDLDDTRLALREVEVANKELLDVVDVNFKKNNALVRKNQEQHETIHALTRKLAEPVADSTPIGLNTKLSEDKLGTLEERVRVLEELAGLSHLFGKKVHFEEPKKD